MTRSTQQLRGGSCDDDDVKTLGYDEDIDDDVEDCKKASIKSQPKTFGRLADDGDGSEVEEGTMLLSMMIMLMIIIANDGNYVQNCKTKLQSILSQKRLDATTLAAGSKEKPVGIVLKKTRSYE